MRALAWFLLGINAAIAIARLRAGSWPVFNITAVLALAVGLASCEPLPDRPLAPCTIAHADDTHNSCGGYIPACGSLPPLVGDDC